MPERIPPPDIAKPWPIWPRNPRPIFARPSKLNYASPAPAKPPCTTFLFLRRSVVGRACEQPPPIRERHARNVRRSRDVARLPAVDQEHGAGRKVGLLPSAPDQRIRGPRLERPVHHLAVGLDVQINPGMRVRKLHLRDLTRQFDRLVLIELRGE